MLRGTATPEFGRRTSRFGKDRCILGSQRVNALLPRMVSYGQNVALRTDGGPILTWWRRAARAENPRGKRPRRRVRGLVSVGNIKTSLTCAGARHWRLPVAVSEPHASSWASASHLRSRRVRSSRPARQEYAQSGSASAPGSPAPWARNRRWLKIRFVARWSALMLPPDLKLRAKEALLRNGLSRSGFEMPFKRPCERLRPHLRRRQRSPGRRARDRDHGRECRRPYLHRRHGRRRRADGKFSSTRGSGDPTHRAPPARAQGRRGMREVVLFYNQAAWTMSLPFWL